MASEISQKRIPEVKETYFSDVAIESEEADLLGYGKFADRIANALDDNSSQKGFVIGVQAKWGLGKSSLLNLITRKVEKTPKVVVLRYNPWMLPDVNHLAAFFTELAKVAKYKANADELSEKLIKYSGITRLVETISASYERVYDTFLAVITGGILVTSTTSISNFPTVLLAILLLVTMLVRIIHHWIELRIERTSSILKEKQTLSEIKNELNSYLSTSETKYVVMIDDIDRLAPEQICEIFQIVKNNGDLANISYILAYDKEVVQNVLATRYVDLYRSFPDKIVQIEFTLPLPDRTLLKDYFLNGLQKILDEILPESADKYWEDGRWSNLFELYLRGMFGSLREAKRILNAVRFNIHHIVSGENLEVNPVDFIAVEILRLQYPQVHEFIRRNKNVFIEIRRPTEILGISDHEKKQLYSIYMKQLDEIQNERERLKVKGLLEELFPRVQMIGNKLEITGHA